MKFARAVFIFEAIVLNAGTGLLCFFVPAQFASFFSPTPVTGTALEFLRWYGVLLWVLAYAMLRVLPMNDNRVLRPLVEALLFGDFAHLAASALYFKAVSGLTIPSAIMMFFTVLLAIIRINWLRLAKSE